MTQAPSALRPLELGELFDRTITFWRSHLKPLFALGVGFQLVVYALSKALSIGLVRLTQDKSAATPELPMLVGITVGMMVIAALLMWTYWANGVAISAYVAPLLLQQEATPRTALRRTFSRLGPITTSLLAYGLLSMGVMVLWFTPAGVVLTLSGAMQGSTSARLVALGLFSLWGVGALFLLLWVCIRLAVCGPVLATEELGGVGTLRRSWRLISGRISGGLLGRVTVRAGVVFAVAVLVLMAVNLVLSIPVFVITLISTMSHPDAAMARQAILVPAELLRVAGMGLFEPITWVFAVVFYLDLRVRKEGLDLELQLTSEAA